MAEPVTIEALRVELVKVRDRYLRAVDREEQEMRRANDLADALHAHPYREEVLLRDRRLVAATALLREVEWAGDDGCLFCFRSSLYDLPHPDDCACAVGTLGCPEAEGNRDRGHASGCKLGDFLASEPR